MGRVRINRLKARGKRGRLAAGIAAAAIIVLPSLVSVFYLPYPPLETNNLQVLAAPSLPHIAGCDTLGRDILSRLMAGGRATLEAAFVSVAIAAFTGTMLGSYAGYGGGAADVVIMRAMDAISAFPGILLSLAAAGMSGKRGALIASIAIMFTPSYTRLIRMAAASLRSMDFVRRERAIGMCTFAIITRHIVPNTIPTLLPAVLVGLSNAILTECTLSFLGLGTAPPYPSWGRMLQDAGQCVLSSPWYAAITGCVITAAIFSFNCIASAWEDSG